MGNDEYSRALDDFFGSAPSPKRERPSETDRYTVSEEELERRRRLREERAAEPAAAPEPEEPEAPEPAPEEEPMAEEARAAAPEEIPAEGGPEPEEPEAQEPAPEESLAAAGFPETSPPREEAQEEGPASEEAKRAAASGLVPPGRARRRRRAKAKARSLEPEMEAAPARSQAQGYPPISQADAFGQGAPEPEPSFDALAAPGHAQPQPAQGYPPQAGYPYQQVPAYPAQGQGYQAPAGYPYGGSPAQGYPPQAGYPYQQVPAYPAQGQGYVPPASQVPYYQSGDIPMAGFDDEYELDLFGDLAPSDPMAGIHNGVERLIDEGQGRPAPATRESAPKAPSRPARSRQAAGQAARQGGGLKPIAPMAPEPEGREQEQEARKAASDAFFKEEEPESREKGLFGWIKGRKKKERKIAEPAEAAGAEGKAPEPEAQEGPAPEQEAAPPEDLSAMGFPGPEPPEDESPEAETAPDGIGKDAPEEPAPAEADAGEESPEPPHEESGEAPEPEEAPKEEEASPGHEEDSEEPEDAEESAPEAGPGAAGVPAAPEGEGSPGPEPEPAPEAGAPLPSAPPGDETIEMRAVQKEWTSVLPSADDIAPEPEAAKAAPAAEEAAERAGRRMPLLPAILGVIFGCVIMSALFAAAFFMGQNTKSAAYQTAPVSPPVIAEEEQLSIEDIAQTVPDSVVGISGSGTSVSGSQVQTYTSVGSGFYASPDGYIVTNDHVVRPVAPESLTVLADDDSQYPASVVWQDQELDLALLKIDVSGKKALDMGDSGASKVGQSVIAVGNPLGLEYSRTVTAGIISALERTVVVDGSLIAEGLIQTDAAINSGNSGGPLVDISGQVIGVNTYKEVQGEGLGFAIPINVFKPIIKDVVETGNFVPVAFGVTGIDREQAAYQPGAYPDFPEGIYVTATDPGSPSEAAGLAPGDTIVSIDGEPVRTVQQLRTVLFGKDPGDRVRIGAVRNGENAEFEAVLG